MVGVWRMQVAPETPEEQIDAMVAELDNRKAKHAGMHADTGLKRT